MDIRSRHDALVRTLRRRGTTTVGELAGEVDASRRTVLRDLVALRDEGFVIHAEAGRGGGVRLDPGSVQTTSRLTVTEVFALIVGVAAMRGAHALPFAGPADAGLAKIERTMPAAHVADLRAMLDCLHVGRLAPEQDLHDIAPVDPDLLPAFETAFLERLALRFDYVDARGARTSREVEPQALLVLPPLWYVVAWDASRSGFRHFRMDRIACPRIVENRSFRRHRVPFEDDVCPFRELARRP